MYIYIYISIYPPAKKKKQWNLPWLKIPTKVIGTKISSKTGTVVHRKTLPFQQTACLSFRQVTCSCGSSERFATAVPSSKLTSEFLDKTQMPSRMPKGEGSPKKSTG